MSVKCPVCQTEYELEPGTYQCQCGAKFVVKGSETAAEADSLADGDLDKTIPPQRHKESEPSVERTMPGKRDRKPDGRFELGDLIMGRYKVLAELGQGGMGVVYKCFDETAGIEIALKALPPELSHSTEEMEDIRDNFQLVSKLVHQNIAISKNLERDNSNGNYYLIMECVEGEDLRRWIKRKRKENALTLETVLPIIRQVAAALDYAHEQKIIHRDIKPGNIMIDQQGQVKVLDFGLAAQIHTSMTRVSMAYHGTSGTGPYMAPEQWRGRAQGAAADQYALAVMTYEMLSGHLPFESSDAAVLKQAVLDEEPEPLVNVSRNVQVALSRGMSKDPAERFSSCNEFVDALEGQNTKGANRKRGKGMWVALAAVIVLAVIGIGYGYHQSAKARRIADEQRLAEEQRLAAERQQKAEEERLAEEQRVAAERQRKVEEERLAEEQRLAAERQRKAEEQRLAEEQRQRKIREEQANGEAESAAAEKERERQDSASDVASSSADSYNFNSLIFYAPLEQEMSCLSTGQAITTHGNVTYTDIDGIRCAYFDGRSMLSFGKNNILGNSPCTMCIWAYSTSNSSERETAFVIGRQTRNSKRDLVRYLKRINFEGFYSGNIYSEALSVNKWNFVTFTYDGRNCQLYINGQLTGSSQATLDTLTDQITVGALMNVDGRIAQPWKGYLSHARIYDRCLSQQEIELLASELKPNKKTTLSRTTEITVQGDNETAWFPGKLFKPPYTIRAKCKTNKYNIRVVFLHGEIIFNWELDPYDLRLDIPGISSPRNSKGNGFVGINTYADIEVKVFPTTFFVYVNGELRYRGTGNWQNVESQVGIKTALGHPRQRYNNVVTIKDFSVEPGK